MRNRIQAQGILLLIFLLLTASAPAAAQSASAKERYDLALDQAIIHYEQFKIHLENKDNGKAMKELQAIVDIDFPKGFESSDGVMLQVDAHILLGEMNTELAEKEKDAKKKKDLLEKALGIFKQGLAKAPAVHELTYQIYMDLGHTYKLMGKSDDALEAYKSAEKINKKLQEQKKQQKSS